MPKKPKQTKTKDAPIVTTYKTAGGERIDVISCEQCKGVGCAGCDGMGFLRQNTLDLAL